jgi:hypothetical protein
VGAALAEIRATRLYRATHDRFEDYCLDKWGLTLSRCNQIIQTTRTYDNLVAGAPQDAELLAQTNEHALRPLSRLAPELQTATWELIRRIEQRPAGTTIEAVVASIKEAIADGWEERAVTATDTNSREPNPVCHGGSTAQTGVTRTRRILERRSDQLGNFCRWANRINTWDPEAIALADDDLCLKRRLKTARQLRTFCETLIQVIEARLLRNNPAAATTNI